MRTREKVAGIGEMRVVRYSEDHWNLLRNLRRRAWEIMSRIPAVSYLHGSTARGDVNEKSDIDIVILDVIPSYLIEASLDYVSRRMVQATPNGVIRAVYELDDKTSVIFPLVPMKERELEFYDFGGKIPMGFQGRVPGVNKKLLMILPNEEGHEEWSIINREEEVAHILGISPDTVRERVRVLRRRDRIGRTGVYLNIEVPENRGVEEYLKILSDRDPAIRRRVRG